MAKKKPTAVEIQILELKRARISGYILGSTPMIFNAMSEKVKQRMLNPPKKENQAALEARLKHDPIQEYRSSVYRNNAEKPETALAFPAVAIKMAMAEAAIEIPGATKASIFRLLRIHGQQLPVYGIPELFMCVVKQAGRTKAPDIRTRAILRNWAIPFSISFTVPNLSEPSVMNLLQAAGIIIGVGDYRQEKGRGDYGLFEVVASDHKEIAALQKSAGYKQQMAALENPNAYDLESEALWEWFEATTKERGQEEMRWPNVLDEAVA